MRETENEFMKLFLQNPNENIGLAAQLKKGEWLNDDGILKFAYLLACKKGKTLSDVRIIGPCLLEVMLKSFHKDLKLTESEKERRMARNIKNYRCNFEPDVPLIIIPIHYADHWSLLYWRREPGKWYTMDSLGRYHSERYIYTLNILHERGYLPIEMFQQAGGMDCNKIQRIEGLKRQPGGWECGTYVLLYILILLEAPNDRALQNSVNLLSERNREKLTKKLLSYI